MKTRALVLVAVFAAAPFVSLAACSDNNTQTDSGPQNNDSGNKQDVAQQQDTGTQNNDAGPDAPDPCSTGLKFDNTLVPGYPNNIPQP